jgi:cytochrome P450
VEETFRYDSPVQGLARTTTQDVAIGDTVIPSGARVQLRYGAANRDPEHYADPGRFQLDRPAPPGVRHLALGHGIHFCLGAALARLEGTIALEEIVRVMPEWDVTNMTRRPSAEVRGPATLDLTFAPAVVR